MRTQLSDHELVSQFLKGDETSLAELIDRHKSKVFTSIIMFVKDKYLAEDLFQDTFIKVVDTLRSGKYKEEGKFLPWVMRIAHNLCIDHYRKVKRIPAVVNNEGFDVFEILKFSEKNAQDEMIQDETREKVRALVEKLPPEQKEVVVLRHYAGLSFKEIAQLTDVSINTALGRMRYALQNMRKVISEKEIMMHQQ
jgi:RNA polymerase sigma-70 factor (ECF subfamily)